MMCGMKIPNLYVKWWPREDVDAELLKVLGVRGGTHAWKEFYRAWSLDLIIPKTGMLTLTFTDDDAAFRRKWIDESLPWEWRADWSLLRGRET